MAWWGWIIVGLLAVYWLGFIVIFGLEVSIGPVTPGLAMYRALVWPYFIATGKPAGYREPWELD